jgi:hypothetical protein
MQSNEDFITIPKSWLYELLCSDPPSHVFAAEVRSRTVTSDFSPSKVRIELGRLLAVVDSNRYHVILYEDTKVAEVWSKSEWDRSSSKRLAQVLTAADNREVFTLSVEKRQAIKAWLKANMNIEPDSYAGEKLTAAFAKLTTLPEELKMFPGLGELLSKYGNLNTQTNRDQCQSS